MDQFLYIIGEFIIDLIGFIILTFLPIRISFKS